VFIFYLGQGNQNFTEPFSFIKLEIMVYFFHNSWAEASNKLLTSDFKTQLSKMS